MVTKYISPLYKGRLDASDAAIDAQPRIDLARQIWKALAGLASPLSPGLLACIARSEIRITAYLPSQPSERNRPT
jgi:hypothetical protein